MSTSYTPSLAWIIKRKLNHHKVKTVWGRLKRPSMGGILDNRKVIPRILDDMAGTHLYTFVSNSKNGSKDIENYLHYV